MTYELILPLMMFALVSSITPGPNNLMLLASGANFGFRRSLPHMLGISLGFAFMVFLVGLGLAQVFEQYPVLKLVLKVLAVAYMLYLAWKIANAAAPKAAKEAGKPFTFLQAAAFQWVNPKAWAMALTAVTVYAPNQEFAVIAVVAAVFCAVNLPSVTFWAVLGQQAQKVLTNQRRLRVFNVTMAAVLVASLYSVLVF
jgi:threonine/homoserine/homoserine lactone efflux protein